MNIRETYKYIGKKLNENGIENAGIKAKILLAYELNQDKLYLITHDTEEVELDVYEKLNKDLELLISGYPIQYITKKQEFMGLEFYVDKNVLIPQPDTEILVEEAINKIKQIKSDDKENISVLDLCTGSGIIGISISKYTNVLVKASDISNKALEIAQKNANDNKVNIEYIQSDLFENINEKFDIICSNPPYIKTDIIQILSQEVQQEPHIALDGGKDGLYFYREIIKESVDRLNQGGYLLLEIGYDQKEDVIKLLNDNGNYTEIYAKKDYGDNDRIIVAKRM